MAKLPIYNIDFHGYKRDKDVEKLPTYSGIYMIYRCTYNDIGFVSAKQI